jgi:cell division protease FtsH
VEPSPERPSPPSRRRLPPRKLALALVVVGLAFVLLNQPWQTGPHVTKLRLDQFFTRVDAHQVRTATVKDASNEVVGRLADGRRYQVTFPSRYQAQVVDELRRGQVAIKTDLEQTPLWLQVLLNVGPFLLVVGIFLWFISSSQAGGGKVMKFGRSRAKRHNGREPQVTFADVAGLDEAVEELGEIKEFLRDPGRFQAMGAKIPKGVILYGPPGTGKTLLARAVAGEAGAPFFSISGSDFVEMFVGVGASRVRDLFKQAKDAAPAIVFVDEIDAVGRHRGAGLGGGHDEREQTLNQLLVEMDGFNPNTGVILIAASNRPDILDPALLRPGRFDRQILVDRPDLVGRRAILEVHAKGKPLDPSVDLGVMARRTPGFTGADLANLLNEAALLATRRGEAVVTNTTLAMAVERVIAGPERRTRLMSDKEKRVIAFHESGHALVGHVLPGTDPIHKVSIIARGQALGWTLSLPTEDRFLQTRSELRDELAMLLGGRTAEELIFGDPTTGAANDIERATEIARAMVTTYGMSDRLGPRKLGEERNAPFLGRDLGHEPNYSDEVAASIDAEMRRLLDEAHIEAREILELHRATLDRLADALIEHETLEESELLEIFAGVGTWSSASETTHAPGPPSGSSPDPSSLVTRSERPPDPQRPS